MAYRKASLAFRAPCISMYPVRSFHATSTLRIFSKDFLVPKTSTPQLLQSYLAGVSTALPPELLSLQEETISTFSDAHKMTSPVQGRLLYHLVRMTRPRLVLELGCFTGFGAISMALGLGPDPQQRDRKKLVTCEIDERAAEIARRWVTKCGVEDAVEIRMGSGLDT
ncbi:S-adenosyl-L-methionine-dependent methyltransferase [Endogone sp. FLAS-F59071]|nr:S-adenosyl-L-methionine-dependent methyltransferase [Endogone sp. FLAS-F59071]|eukprot:RUS22169.1 S-adenosyl-L-methionine-dependent methyltransferase [Endogone sp. FLAS-F59071]